MYCYRKTLVFSVGKMDFQYWEFSKLSPMPTIFLMSLKAGGVGINLTAASRVFLIDPVSYVFSDLSPDSPTIFLMSLKAGGVGINLTAASRVFLINPVSLFWEDEVWY